jgi:hypothetical protein
MILKETEKLFYIDEVFTICLNQDWINSNTVDLNVL